MKINSNFISLILKLVSGILIISTILEYILSLIPPQLQNPNWQVNLINGLVDQGIIPLLGVCLLFLAWWIEDNDNSAQSSSPIRTVVLTFACLFGLLFLLLIPLHLSNVNKISSGVIAQIDQQVKQQETQVQGFITQLEAISKDPERLKQEIEQRNQVLQAGGVVQGQQLSGQQLELLTNQKDQLQELLELSQKPEELKAKLEEMKTDLQLELKEKESQEKTKTKNRALRQSLKTSIRSLILAIAYSVIGWFGFKASIWL